MILVVDDDPAVRDALKFSLGLEGVTVHACDSGTALLDRPDLEQAGCIVLDYKMPEMDGFEVLEKLEERKVLVPIILIASSVPNQVWERARRAGVAYILEKPLLDSALIDCIREIVF